MPRPAIPPKLLERECDGDWCLMSEEQKLELITERLREGTKIYHGCGVRFQWYWGMNCCCPNCGRMYNVIVDYLKSGIFSVRAGESDAEDQVPRD